jgi:hypothetical protein
MLSIRLCSALRMPLLSFWKSNRDEVLKMTVEQVVSSAGDGHLTRWLRGFKGVPWLPLLLERANDESNQANQSTERGR